MQSQIRTEVRLSVNLVNYVSGVKMSVCPRIRDLLISNYSAMGLLDDVEYLSPEEMYLVTQIRIDAHLARVKAAGLYASGDSNYCSIQYEANELENILSQIQSLIEERKRLGVGLGL